MKRFFIYFIIAFVSGACFQASLMPNTVAEQASQIQYSPLKATTLDSLNQKLPFLKSSGELPGSTTPSDIVRWLLVTLGSFITTIIMYFLHRWFPKVFPTAQISAYESDGDQHISTNT